MPEEGRLDQPLAEGRGQQLAEVQQDQRRLEPDQVDCQDLFNDMSVPLIIYNSPPLGARPHDGAQN